MDDKNTSLVAGGWAVTLGGEVVTDMMPDAKFLAPDLVAQSTELKEQAEGVEKVVSDSSEASAQAALVDINRYTERVDTLLKTSTAPFSSIVNRLNKAGDTLTKVLYSEKERITGLLRAYGRQKVIRQDEARRKQEAIASGDKAKVEEVQLKAAVLQTRAVEATQAAAVAPVGFWSCKLIGNTPQECQASILKLANARPDFVKMELAVMQLRSYLKNVDGKTDLPGIEVFKDINVRGRK